MSAVELKNYIVDNVFNKNDYKQEDDGANDNLFINRFEKFTNSKTESTKELYDLTLRHIKKFDASFEKLTFEDVDKYWLSQFDNYLAKTSPSQNARNIHLRNIRAVFNDAIDDEITSFYPFRRFKIKAVATAKRSLTLQEIRTLFNCQDVKKHEVQYLDMFKLIFYLIGINIKDLCYLEEIKKGRIEYNRAKTKKLYSIKVEREALEIIEKYRGNNYLLNILDRYGYYKDYTKKLNKNLKKIGESTRQDENGVIRYFPPLFPNLTTYWARHTWATIAAELDIPKETIAAALGHSIGNPITSIYIDFNEKKIDEANRLVIDYVNNTNHFQSID